jgi:hypothetical protein
VFVGLKLAIGDGVDGLLQLGRPQLAPYIGGIDARGKNFYDELAPRYGYGRAASSSRTSTSTARRTRRPRSCPTSC